MVRPFDLYQYKCHLGGLCRQADCRRTGGRTHPKGKRLKKVLVVFFLAGITMLGAFRFAGWYAQNAALPRYCEDPAGTIVLVRKILSEENPSGDEKRRPYLVAAKLIFLVPQLDGETQDVYLTRLRSQISATCGTAF